LHEALAAVDALRANSEEVRGKSEEGRVKSGENKEQRTETAEKRNGDELAAMRCYVLARAAMSGLRERRKAEMQRDIERARSDVRSIGNADGNVVMAERSGGGSVYVVSGSVVMLEDGSGVDLSRSSDVVTVVDAETGERSMVSPKFLSGVEFVGSVDALAERRVADIVSRYRGESEEAESAGAGMKSEEVRVKSEEGRVKRDE
jgi:hypothetical protein